MSLKDIFITAVAKAQQEDSCHKKLMKLVENAFVIPKQQELLNTFLKILYKFYSSNYCADKSPHVARGLEFLAKVAINITLKCVQPIQITEACGTSTAVYDITLDPFFNNILKASLKYARAEKVEVRFNTCYFIMVLLQNIGNNVEMDQSVCNIMVDSLVDLLYDNRANIRLQAIKALMRLQEPSNPDCLVLQSFWTLFSDSNVEVRRTIINMIAPHPHSFSKIKMSLTDKDPTVRQEVYIKFSEINPKLYLKIVDRNLILTSGLADSYKKIHSVLTEKLLPKWLSHFEGNYLQFFKALRLDADENDIVNFEQLCSELLGIFLKTCSLSDIVKYLPVNKEDKLIPVQQLQIESVLYWSGVINYLRKMDNGEDYLEEILPELTSFSNYIEKVIREKCSAVVDEWENLEFQNILYQLFKIASGFDMSDEVGRKTFYSLILQIMTTHKFHQKVIDQIMQVASMLNTDKGSLSIDFCQVISEIREPLVDETPSEDKLRQQNFEVTKLKVKLHQLEIDEEEALKKKDFQLAHIVHNELEKYQKELDSLKTKLVVSEKVRMPKDDPETLCKCLDILIGLLKIIPQNCIFPALQSCRDEFLMPLLTNKSSEVHWRFMLCLGLFSLLDKDLAFKHANILCLPIATYRTIPNYDKLALKTSVACVSDLIRVYGTEVVGLQETAQSEAAQPTSRRKLYSEDLTEPEIVSKDDITMDIVIDIILDMIDDEDEGVCSTAICSMCKLIRNNFPINSELIGRLILKWYNPETEKRGAKFHQMLGTLIECFATYTRGAKQIVQKAMVSIISSIANASSTSPLLEIDVENVLKFLAVLTNSTDDTENIHIQIAADTLERMSNRPNDNCNVYLVKLLTYLELNFDNIDRCKGLLASTESLLNDLVDKVPTKHLAKFRDNLKNGIAKATNQGGESDGENGGQNQSNCTSNATKDNNPDQSLSTSKSLPNGVLRNECTSTDADEIEDGSEQEKGNSSCSVSDSKGDTNHELEENPKGEPSEILNNKNHRQADKTKLLKTSEGREIRTGTVRSKRNCLKNQGTNSESGSVEDNVLKKTDDIVKTVGGVKTKNVQITSNIVLREINEEKTSPKDKQTRSKNNKTSVSTDSTAIVSPMGSKRRRLSNNVTPSTEVQSKRPPSFSSRYQNYLTSIKKTSKNKTDETPARKQLQQKRIFQTPLSVVVNRKSKRLSRGNLLNETPSASTKILKITSSKKNIHVGTESTDKPSDSDGKTTVVRLRKSSRNLSSDGKSTTDQGSQKINILPTTSKTDTKRKQPTQKMGTNVKGNSNIPKINNSKDLSDKSSAKDTESVKSVKAKQEKNILDRNTRKNGTNNTENETSKQIKIPIGIADNNSEKKPVTAEKVQGTQKMNSKEPTVEKLRLRSREINDNTNKSGKNEQKEEKRAGRTNTGRFEKTSNNDNESTVGVKSNTKNKQGENSKKDDIETVKKNEITYSKRTANKQGSERSTRQNSKENKKEPEKAKIVESVTKSLQKPKEIGNKKSSKLGESSREKSKNKTKQIGKRQPVSSSKEVNNGVLKNLNNVMDGVNDTVITRRSNRLSFKSGDNILSGSSARSRSKEQPEESLPTSKKKLDFSDMDETLLKTFLQGDEELLPLEDISAENISSFSSTLTSDSKKENLSISVSTSSSSSRRSTLRKRSRMDVSPNKSISPVKRKKARRANKRY